MFEFRIAAQSGAARAGTLTLPHGAVETPVFMPVGTQGSVRALSPNDLRGAGATLVLANTYHLHVRPSEQVVEKLGALHRFMGWDRPLLTDFGRLSGVFARGFPPGGRGRRGIPESRGWQPPHAHSRARHGDPMDARRRHCDGVSITWWRGERTRRPPATPSSGRCDGWSGAASGTRN